MNPSLIADANRILVRMADTVSSAVVIAAKPRKVISAKVDWQLVDPLQVFLLTCPVYAGPCLPQPSP